MSHKVIPIAPDYTIDEKGEIISYKGKEPKAISQKVQKDGYPSVTLRAGDRYITRRVHRLVAITHIPNPEGYNEVNHINGIKHDNRVENLEWCDHTHNIRHSFATGLKVNKAGEESPNFGGKNPSARVVVNMQTGIFYDCIKDAAIAHNIPRTSLNSMISGRRPNLFNIQYA